MNLMPIVQTLFAFLVAPLLPGIINRTKARFAGRQGQPIFQAYYDLWKLLHKGAVYSRMTTWLFRLGPMVSLSAIAIASLMIPWGGQGAPVAFTGDFVLVAYLLGLARVLTVVAALDTGSSFEGMGASREVFFSALAEPALLIGLAALARVTGNFSLSAIYAQLTPELWMTYGPLLLVLIVSLFVIFLAENARIPVDDPNTHLELTMIHEVMVLDHGGPDFAFIAYGGALKLWMLGGLLVGLALPIRTTNLWVDSLCFLFGMFGLAVAVGVVESIMARLRLVRVPQMLVGAGALSLLAIFLSLR